jgi:hypothetical protein
MKPLGQGTITEGTPRKPSASPNLSRPWLIKRRLLALAEAWLDLVDRADYLMRRQTLKFMDTPGRRHPERT